MPEGVPVTVDARQLDGCLHDMLALSADKFFVLSCYFKIFDRKIIFSYIHLPCFIGFLLIRMSFVLLQIYQTGTEQFNTKPLKGITYLQEHELLSSPLDPKEVVRFIKENSKLDKKQIGDFISNKKYVTVLEEYQKYVVSYV